MHFFQWHAICLFLVPDLTNQQLTGNAGKKTQCGSHALSAQWKQVKVWKGWHHCFLWWKHADGRLDVRRKKTDWHWEEKDRLIMRTPNLNFEFLQFSFLWTWCSFQLCECHSVIATDMREFFDMAFFGPSQIRKFFPWWRGWKKLSSRETIKIQQWY